MQCFIATLLMAGLVLGAPEAPVSENNGGPYPPSGWKPSGRLLLIPARQTAQQVYGPPPTEYGSPTTEAEATTTEFPSTTPQEESGNPGDFAGTSGFAFQQQQLPGVEHGVYHVLLPDGRLQRVEYTTAPLKAAQQLNTASFAQKQESNNFQQGQQYQQPQNERFQQGQFQQTSYPQPAQPGFPSSFPQHLTGVQKPQNSFFQQSQFSQNNNFHTSQNNVQSAQYQQPQNGNIQSQQTIFPSGFSYPQNSNTQNKNQAQTQYPQQPEYDQNASQNQFDQKKYNKQQKADNQNKQSSTNIFSSSSASQTSSRFTSNSNAATAQQQALQPFPNTNVQTEQVEYQPVYFAQQQPNEPTATFNGFVANVQYKDVEPISSPIYSYNPAPLVRILRKTE